MTKVPNVVFEQFAECKSLAQVNRFLQETMNIFGANLSDPDFPVPYSTDERLLTLSRGNYLNRHREQVLYIPHELVANWGNPHYLADAVRYIKGEQLMAHYLENETRSVKKAIQKTQGVFDSIKQHYGKTWTISSRDIQEVHLHEMLETQVKRSDLLHIAAHFLVASKVQHWFASFKATFVESLSISPEHARSSIKHQLDFSFSSIKTQYQMLFTTGMITRIENVLTGESMGALWSLHPGKVHIRIPLQRNMAMTIISASGEPDENNQFSYNLLLTHDE